MKKRLYVLVIIASVLVNVAQPKERFVKAKDEIQQETEYIVSSMDNNTYADVCSSYKSSIIHNEEDNLSEHNAVVMKLSKKEADDLEKEKKVNVEQNCEVKGAGEIQKSSEDNVNWNLSMINVESDLIEKKDANKIKVAIIDSGVDYTNGIKVKKRYNLVPGEDNINILYEDRTGHGTAVAGVIAANSNNGGGIDGIDPYVDLYSVKVLDSENRAPVSRVVEGIYWAIEQKVNIINLSLGTTDNSFALEKAVKDASDKGILIIAAAGNDSKNIQYPAAYKEVISVGSITSKGKVSESSAGEEKAELVAPGEDVVASSFLDGVIKVGGTSIAAPHITGVAARLWAKDTTKSKEYIRKMLLNTAKKTEDGARLVDLKYALDNYNEFKENYSENKEICVDPNEEKVQSMDCTKEVSALWDKKSHTSVSDYSGFSGDELKLLYGALIYSDYDGRKEDNTSDAGLARMTYNRPFHGYGYGIHNYFGSDNSLKSDNKVKSNYISNTAQLYRLALNYSKGIYNDTSKIAGIYNDDYNEIILHLNSDYKNGIVKTINPYASKDSNGNYFGSKVSNKTISWYNIFGWCMTKWNGSAPNFIEATNRNRSIVILGLALHNAMDIFSHSSCRANGTLITHEYNSSGQNADTASYYSNRLECAKYVAKNILNKYKKSEDIVASDFDFSTAYNTSSNNYTLMGYAEYMKSYNWGYYENHKSNVDKMSHNFN